MSRSPRRLSPAPRSCLALLLLAMVLGSAGRAHAYHDEEQRQTDLTAYTLKHKELRLGLMQLGLGLWDQLQITTYTLPWIAGAVVRKTLPNLHLKWMFWDRHGLSFGVRAGMYYIDSRKLADDDGLLRVFAFPLNFAASYRFNDAFTLSTELTYVRVHSDGNATAEDVTYKGVGAADNVQLNGTLEWRATKTFALIGTFRWMAKATKAVVKTNIPIDDQTNVAVEAEVDQKNAQNALSGSLTAAWSWKHFNVDAGVGYGAYFFGGIGLVYARNLPYPVLDVYWRF